MKRVRENIKAHVLCGESEVHAAYGISPNKLLSMMKEGLKFYNNGRINIFYINDINDFIQKKWKITQLEIKALKQSESSEISATT